MNPYQSFISDLARLMERVRPSPLGGFPPPPPPKLSPDAPRALIFSPHPDDEVIIGGLPLRLLREQGWQVINVAVTLGSSPARQSQRWAELEACCRHIGFDLQATGPHGLEGINLKSRAADPAAWNRSVTRISELIRGHRPQAVFFPHDDDWNSTHIGTHHLVVDALAQGGSDLECLAVETEFWGAMKAPNLLVESAEPDLV